MPKRSSKREDANQTAHRTLMEAIGEKPKTPKKPKNEPQVGSAGGRSRAKVLSDERRSKIAKEAAKARWKRP